MKHTIFTICSANYLPTAKVLLDSLAAHEPDSRRVLVLVEREWPAEQRETLAQSLNCEVMPLSALSARHMTLARKSLLRTSLTT